MFNCNDNLVVALNRNVEYVVFAQSARHHGDHCYGGRCYGDHCYEGRCYGAHCYEDRVAPRYELHQHYRYLGGIHRHPHPYRHVQLVGDQYGAPNDL